MHKITHLLTPVISFTTHPLLGAVPQVYAVRMDENGKINYAESRILPNTASTFDVGDPEDIKTLMKFVSIFDEAILEKKFAGPGKRVKNLEKLLADPAVKLEIMAFLDKTMHELLTFVTEKKFLLAADLQRRTWVPENIVKFAGNPQPSLKFRKTEEGIFYKLRFVDEKGRKWRISERNIRVISNNPAWFLADKNLYHVPEINGNMVKPFSTKEEVLIPPRMTSEYFKRFILRVAARADIEADGFEIRQTSVPGAMVLSLAENLKGDPCIAVSFKYEEELFHYADKSPQRMRLLFTSDDNIVIRQFKRDIPAEKSRMAILDKFQLRKSDSGNYIPEGLASSVDKFDLWEWLVNQRPALEREGIEVGKYSIKGLDLIMLKPEQQVAVRYENDWFDIHGDVVIGEYRFPFVRLMPSIREGNRVYTLPDGKCFIIPEEWMAQYKAISGFAKIEGDLMRLPKAQHTLLPKMNTTEKPLDFTEDFNDREFTAPKGLKAQLRPYQQAGFKWLQHLYDHDLGGCLADDMGLGKTLQTIAVLMYAHEQRNMSMAQEFHSQRLPSQMDMFSNYVAARGSKPLQALIVMPASLVFNWELEIRKFAPELQVYAHTGSKRHKTERMLMAYDIILTTYTIAIKDIALLRKIEFSYVILDESQMIRNRNSKIFSAVNELNTGHKLSLSGTPIENSLADLWSQMQFINPNLLGTFPFFKKEFMAPIEKSHDESKLAQIKSMIRPYMLRRTKELVAPDLPKLTLQVYYSEMTEAQSKWYDSEKSAVRNFIMENFDNPTARPSVLNALVRLRQLANHPRLLPPKDVQEDYYTEESGKFADLTYYLDVLSRAGSKALIFSQFVKHLDIIREYLELNGIRYSWLTGDTKSEDRKAQIEKFESDPDIPFFLLSIKAGGTGLNLTAANYVLIADPWWNPQVEQQAIARAHRIGQEKPVIAIRFIAKNTIEEKIQQLQERKKTLADDIISSDNLWLLSREEILSFTD